MTITIYRDLEQGTPEWHQARCGIVTASEVKKIITPEKISLSRNKTSHDYLCELISQQLTGRTEVYNIGYNGIRGKAEEERAIQLYNDTVEPVERVGFITNSSFGYTLGFSPDGLIKDGFLESKSKLPKLLVQYLLKNKLPVEHKLQILHGFLVTGAKRCVFTAFANGFNMWYPSIKRDEKEIDALKYALDDFHVIMENTRQELLARIDENKRKRIIVPVEYIEVAYKENEEIDDFNVEY